MSQVSGHKNIGIYIVKNRWNWVVKNY